MRKSDLYRQLKAYAQHDVYPFHMPGHKRNIELLRNTLPYALDITEIHGFDDLHAPKGILKDLNNRLAALYGTRHSFPLVNGSTCGILAGIATAVRRGDKILLARNCHKSVYNAVELLGLVPVYIQPPVDERTGILGSIPPETVQETVEQHPDIRLCVLTSPTYDGILSDVRAIAEILHQKDIPLLVDEAHGAHLQFTKLKGLSAVHAGADVVVQSLHKTLPSLTQTAVAHLCTDRISPARFQQNLSVFETSSPSYVLLASVSECVRFLELHGERAFADYEARLEEFSTRCKALQRISVLCKGADSLKQHPAFFAFDGGKLPIITANTDLDGQTVLEKLRGDFQIEGEMAAVSYALLMTSVCDTDAGFSRLFAALSRIDARAKYVPNPARFTLLSLPPMEFAPCDIPTEKIEAIQFENAVGKVSLETVWCYPPGIPILLRGERVTPEIADALKNAKAHRLQVCASGGEFPKIKVCD